VTYALKYGALGRFLHATLIKKRLQLIFDYRFSALQRRFGSIHGSTQGGVPTVESRSGVTTLG
jgi:hypothetical protein